MAALIAQNLAPIMFAALVALLLLGYPVAFTRRGGAGVLRHRRGARALFRRNDQPVVAAAPVAARSRARRHGQRDAARDSFLHLHGADAGAQRHGRGLLETVGQLFGTARGGLAYAVIFVGALLAATTGVVAASVIAMGLISLPIMLRYGYDRRLASGVIAASGTLAQIIPPSLVLIVLADQLGRSVGAMYAGASCPACCWRCSAPVRRLGLPRQRPGSCRPRHRFPERVADAGSARSRCWPGARRWRAGG